MLRFWFSLAFAGLLVAFVLPLFAIRRCLAGFGTSSASFLPGFRWRRRAGGFDHQRLWASDEFGFEHAIEAYEELIDVHAAHAWRPR